MWSRHGNEQKHANRNPIQRALIANFHRQVARLVAARAPREILEIGCGQGHVLAALREAGIHCPMHGIDRSFEAIAQARRKGIVGATFEVASAESLIERGAQYDLVLMIEVLEHLPDPEAMLALLSRTAQRHVVLSVPWEPYFRGLNFLRGKHWLALGNDPEHIQHWGRAEFTRFVARRFAVQDAPAAFPWTLLAAEQFRARA